MVKSNDLSTYSPKEPRCVYKIGKNVSLKGAPIPDVFYDPNIVPNLYILGRLHGAKEKRLRDLIDK